MRKINFTDKNGTFTITNPEIIVDFTYHWQEKKV